MHYAGRKARDKSPKLTRLGRGSMIGSMRLSRLRATFVLLLAVLYIGSGVVSALMLCCPHPPTSAEAMMDCDMPGMRCCPLRRGGRSDVLDSRECDSMGGSLAEADGPDGRISAPQARRQLHSARPRAETSALVIRRPASHSPIR